MVLAGTYGWINIGEEGMATKQQACMQFGLQVAILLASIAIAYGVIVTKVNALEKSIARSDIDHDAVIVIVTKLNIMQKDLNDIKQKVGDLYERDF